MSVKRNKIVKFCEDYLKVKDFEDYCVNGLQVEGKEDIKQIVTGVSFSQKLIREAIKKKADMIVVHHGIFDKNLPSPFALRGAWKNRLKLLLENDINLCGFHLPLDAHGEIGNNILLGRLLKLRHIKKFDIFDIGVIGDLPSKINLNDLVKKIDSGLKTKSFVTKGGKAEVKKIGIIAGSYPGYELASEMGADVYLTGEPRESNIRASEEVGINVIYAGHYNTEKMGIQNLGNLISKKFNVKVDFVDVPCDV